MYFLNGLLQESAQTMFLCAVLNIMFDLDRRSMEIQLTTTSKIVSTWLQRLFNKSELRLQSLLFGSLEGLPFNIHGF